MPVGGPPADYYGAARPASNPLAKPRGGGDAATGRCHWDVQPVQHDPPECDRPAPPPPVPLRTMVRTAHGPNAGGRVGNGGKRGGAFTPPAGSRRSRSTKKARRRNRLSSFRAAQAA